MSSIFPFVIRLPHDLIPEFRKVDKETWYEADLKVTSPDSATVIVYDMLDMCRGGRGKHNLDVCLVGIKDKLRKHIEDTAMRAAFDVVEREDMIAFNRRVVAVKSKILSEVFAKEPTT